MEWLNRMKEAIAFIEDNLTEQIDVEEAARRAFTSSFHFQRMFHMLTGITVAEYIRKRRLTLAAQDLSATNGKVLDIALKYGYESPESFAKAFRKVHGLSPSNARTEGVQLRAFPRISFHISLKGDKDMEYKIVNREAFRVTGKSIRVSCKDGENFRRIPEFWQACYADGTVERLRTLHPDGTLLGICMDVHHKDEELTYLIGIEGQIDDANESWATAEIPATTWAMFPSQGALPTAIQGVWTRIFEEWFPATGYEHSGGPEIEFLPAGDDLSAEYQCEVWIPIVKK